MSSAELLFYLIKCVSKGETPLLGKDAPIDGAVALADKQGVLFYVSDLLESAGYGLPEKYAKKRKNEIAKREVQRFCKEKVKDAFVSAGIPFAFLKGDDISAFLPKGAQRFTSDVDFFCREKHSKDVVKIMKSLGFTCEKGGEGTLDFHIEPKITFECHYDLDCGFGYNPYADFSRFETDDGVFYKMNPQDAYVYHIIHFANHFKTAGCGLRALADAFFMKRQIDTESEYVKETLEKVGLTAFNETVKRACAACFEDGSRDGYIKWFVKYLLTSNIYGTSVNRDKVISYNSKGNKTRVFLRRAFPPYREMKIAYPAVEKFPLLLPFAWIYRLISALLFGRKKVKREMESIETLSNEKLKQEREYYKRLGI